MCGIFGVFSKTDISSNEIDTYLAGLKHRGPDSSGYLKISNRNSLGMTRLAINGLLNLSNQPMISENGKLALVFNGEIYNYKLLRTQLETVGYSFSDGSDTEVVLKSYEYWGRESFKNFHGMFAIAIWDNEEQELTLCRDSFGEKPLYFVEQNGAFVFCSRRDLIHKHFNLGYSFSDQETIAYHTLGYVANTHSKKTIDEVTPGHYYVVKENMVKAIIPYRTNVAKRKTIKVSTLSEHAFELDELLEEVINEVADASDVPIGVFMSGGIDSTLIAKKMCESSPDVKLFTVAFSEPEFDESRYAAKIASKIGGDHEIVHVEYSRDLILEAIKSLDIPIADTSIIPFYALSKHAALTHKVCLSGDGGDELFGGYVTYQATILNEALRGLFPPTDLRKTISNHIPSKQGNVDFTYKAKAFLLNCNKDSKLAHQFWRRIFTEAELQEIMPSMRDIKLVNLGMTWNDLESESLISQAMEFDQRTWLRHDLLVKSDRMSMANSLEIRSPFLHPKIADFAKGLPSKFKVNLWQRKMILKEVSNINFGSNFISSTKRGFGSPLSDWIIKNPDDFKSIILSSDLYSGGAIERLFDRHIRRKADNSYKIFALCVWSTLNQGAPNS